MSRDQGGLISPTMVKQHLYCPRFTYYQLALGLSEHQEKRFKVRQGILLHEKKAGDNKGYCRKGLGVKRKLENVRLCHDELGLIGRVDEVLFLDDGTAAPLDYKYAVWKGTVPLTLKCQLAMYGEMIEWMYGNRAERGFLVYARSSNHLEEVVLEEYLFETIRKAIAEIRQIALLGRYPPVDVPESKCGDCAFAKICVK